MKINKINTLDDFYHLMNNTIVWRRALVIACLSGESAKPGLVENLNQALAALKSIPKENGYVLKDNKGQAFNIDLSYEINEMRKDILFFTNENQFWHELESNNPHFEAEVSQAQTYIANAQCRNLISDRDGTVNNYCARYSTSVQSAYNAVWLSSFAQKVSQNSIILTSAPLANPGLIDISVAPSGIFYYAGSKGREFVRHNGQRESFPIAPDQKEQLDQLNNRLSELVKRPQNQKFTFLGSGLQFKFGQTTIARQDINGSVPPQESAAFLQKIKDLVKELDPQANYFRIEDTGKDIEIMLTVPAAGTQNLKDFDKGDGVAFLNKSLNLGLGEHGALICGDTSSDLPMVSKALEYNQQRTYAVIVTTDEQLKQKAKNICAHTLFVSSPDVLVTAFYRLTHKNNN